MSETIKSRTTVVEDFNTSVVPEYCMPDPEFNRIALQMDFGLK